jgi:hypothetical protein
MKMTAAATFPHRIGNLLSPDHQQSRAGSVNTSNSNLSKRPESETRHHLTCDRRLSRAASHVDRAARAFVWTGHGKGHGRFYIMNLAEKNAFRPS